MKIAFLRACHLDRPYQRVMPPLGIGYLMATLKKETPDCEVMYATTYEEALGFQPHILAISSATENFNQAIAYAQKFKEATGRPVLVGGMHITSLPHSLPPSMDVAVLGEGEPVITALVKLMASGRLDSDALRAMPGVAWHDEDGRVVVNPPRLLVEDLDTLPWPDREGLGSKWAWPYWKSAHLISSRGCPYNCSFCSSGREWTRFRAFSAAYIIDEIEALRVQYDPEELFFFDDLFIANRRRFVEFCRLLKERRLHEGVRFRGYARANLIDEEILDLFEEFHFQYIDFGFESNCEKTLRYFNKTAITPEVNQKALDLMKGRNISVGANMIVGAPDETLDDMEASYRFIDANRSQIDRLSVGPLMTMPGTQVWREAEQRGLVSDQFEDWTRMSFDPETWDPERYVYLNRVMPLAEFNDFLMRFLTLQKEINTVGEKKKLELDGLFRQEKYWRLKHELETLKGSRLVQAALAVKDWKRRFFPHND